MSSLPSLNALCAFDAVARLSSVSAAVAELAVTPGAVSRQIGNLEEEVGAALLTRDGRGVRLTSDGRRLEGGLADAFARIDAAVDRLQGPAPSRGLRVTVPLMFASAWLVPGIDRFTAQHTATDVILVDSEEQTKGAAAAGCVVAWGSFEDGAAMPEELFPVCRPELCQGAGLAGLALLELESAAYAPSWPDRSAFITAAGLDRDGSVAGPRLTAGPLLDAARRGKGAMISCTSLAQDDIASGRLVRPVDQAVATDRGYWLLTPRGERHRPDVAGFRSWLLREMGAGLGRGGRQSW